MEFFSPDFFKFAFTIFASGLSSAALLWIFALRVLTRKDLFLNAAQQENEYLQKEAQKLGLEILELKKSNAALSVDLERARQDLAAQTAARASDNEHNKDKIRLLETAKDLLKQEFENLAGKIFAEKNEQSAKNLESVLKPLRENLSGFEKKVQDLYINEAKERAGLATEIKLLHEQAGRISQDAINLTNALKGQAKVQGDWGEVVLERILELSGLRAGQEYKIQETLKADEGARRRPDVIVYLPRDRQIIIDAKVSLTAYERYVRSESEAQKKLALSEHLNSLAAHIKELEQKNYHLLQGVRTLEFVLMFVPIEGAFLTALQADEEFFIRAFGRGILVVSPSTLTVTLRTIEQIWRYERASQNIGEFAREAQNILKKIDTITGDLVAAENAMNKATQYLANAKGRLFEGKGNLQNKLQNTTKYITHEGVIDETNKDSNDARTINGQP